MLSSCPYRKHVSNKIGVSKYNTHYIHLLTDVDGNMRSTKPLKVIYQDGLTKRMTRWRFCFVRKQFPCVFLLPAVHSSIQSRIVIAYNWQFHPNMNMKYKCVRANQHLIKRPNIFPVRTPVRVRQKKNFWRSPHNYQSAAT